MSQENLTKQSAHGVLWIGLSRICSAAFRLLVLAILARWITPEEFGTVGIVFIITGFAEIVAGLGVPSAVVQRKNLTDEHIASGFGIVFGFGVFFSILLIALSGLVVELSGKDDLLSLLRVAAILFPIKAIDSIYRSLLLRKLNFRALALIDVVSFAVGYGVVGVSLAVLGFGAMSIVLATIIQYLLSSIMLWKIIPRLLASSFNLQSCREILKISLGFNMTQVAFFFSQNADKLVVLKTLGVSAMGYYGRASVLSLYPNQLIGQPLDQVIFPILSTCQDDISRLKRAFRGGFALLSSVAWPITIPLVVAAREIVLLVLGSQWEQAVPVFQVLVVVAVVRFANKINDSLIRAKGAVYRCAWRHWLYLVMVGLWCWVGSQFGLVGIAVGAGTAYFISYALMLHLTLDILGMSWGNYLGMLLRPLGVYCATLVCTWFVASGMRDGLNSHVLVVVLSSLIPALLYGLLIYFAPRLLLGAETKWVMSSLWSMVPKGMRNNRAVQRVLHQHENNERLHSRKHGL